ncbi:ribosome biogenesis regulatory protein homolog [Centruroides vittatus]|uniref:ribosome biogenesis regulatory protein homolog n=1 Tax=Centruroides vittatus TaxID=120091 RepID=UPI00350F623F
MADIVSKILLQEDNVRNISVEKAIELEFDIGNILGSDKNPVNLQKLRNDTDNYIISLARDNTQLLINKIWELPTERYEDAVVVKLPDPTTRLPREKPLPKPKPLTKWKEYAKKKGINKRKKEKLVWDETAKEWKPRWGYKSKDNTSNDWVIEIPENADPNIDYFGKKKEEKKERKAKNEFKRLKNIARSQKFKGVDVMPSEKENKIELTKALAIAKVSTASVGKFTDALPEEKKTAKITKKRKKKIDK